MDIATWALVVGIVASLLALASGCFTIYVILRPPRDTDVEALADQLAVLTRRARADTMRRVRQEAAQAPADGVAAGEITVPPQLKAAAQAANIARDPREIKQALRMQLLR